MKRIKRSSVTYKPDAKELREIKREARYKYGKQESFIKDVMCLSEPAFHRKCSIKYPEYGFTEMEYLTLKRFLGIEFNVH